MAKDFTKKMYKTVNELIDSTESTEPTVSESKGLLTRTSRGQEIINDTDKNEPLLKVVEYVKKFRKMREGLKNG
tara:strand:- start:1000 stop:1221 length:222 start_codon:yes stop_codon:yes gene_type:complete